MTYKFKVSSIEYPNTLENDLDGIRRLIGEFEVIKVKHYGQHGMTIWVRKSTVESDLCKTGTDIRFLLKNACTGHFNNK